MRLHQLGEHHGNLDNWGSQKDASPAGCGDSCGPSQRTQISHRQCPRASAEAEGVSCSSHQAGDKFHRIAWRIRRPRQRHDGNPGVKVSPTDFVETRDLPTAVEDGGSRSTGTTPAANGDHRILRVSSSRFSDVIILHGEIRGGNNRRSTPTVEHGIRLTRVPRSWVGDAYRNNPSITDHGGAGGLDTSRRRSGKSNRRSAGVACSPVKNRHVPHAHDRGGGSRHNGTTKTHQRSGGVSRANIRNVNF